MFRLWFLRRQCTCPGKKIDKKPAQGALPKSRPLENPPAALPEAHQNVSDCDGGFAGSDWMNRDFKLCRKGMTELGHAFFILFPD